MAKQDVIDAINATIVPNGSKAINADSLRNLLIMMTENAGEGGSGGGSGDGALRVIVPDLTTVGGMFVDIGEFSPTSFEEVKASAEAEMPGLDWSEYDAAVNAAFAHNAAVAQQLIAKAKTGQGVSLVIDQTPLIMASVSLEFQMQPEIVAFYEDMAILDTQPASCNMAYIKANAEGEAIFGPEMFQCTISPVGEINTDNLGQPNYPSTIAIERMLDGSLVFSTNNVATDTESGS